MQEKIRQEGFVKIKTDRHLDSVILIVIPHKQSQKIKTHEGCNIQQLLIKIYKKKLHTNTNVHYTSFIK